VRAAVLHEYGSAPRCGEFAAPSPAPGQVVVDVAAAALHHFDIYKASGGYYTGPPPLPSVVGTNGVGRLADGRRAYFDATVQPFGSMAEQALVPDDVLFDVAGGLDDAVAAALGSTGLGAWLALAWRSGLQPGETVLVLGATGAVGAIAVQAAKILGAGRVVAAARASERLERQLERGADAIVAIDGDGDLAAAFREAAGGDVHVTIDSLWGEPALAAIGAVARHGRHVQVGQLAGADITLPAATVRSVSLDLRGFSVAHPPIEVMREAYLRLTRHVERGDIVVDVERVPLEQVDIAWEREQKAAGGAKLVVVPKEGSPRP
jgi:NADPH:quinone reductase-like Zn-dependent oxidoreductase